MKRCWIIAGLVIVVVVAGVLLIGRNAPESGSSEARDVVQSQSQSSGATRTGSGASSVVEAMPVEQGFEFVYSEEELSEPVLALLGLDGTLHDYNSLGAAIAMLPKDDIPSDDEAALRDMLTWSNDQFPEGMRPIEINAVKNDVLDRLLRQAKLPEGIGLQLVEMASNSENDPVWRDYCIQFMTPLYERLATENREFATKNTKDHEKDFLETSVSSSEAGGEDMASLELAAVRETMINALDERDETIAGTALIGLELLSRTHGEFDRGMILDKASNIAANEAVSNESRLTALRLTSVAGADESTANTARNLAQTGETAYLRSAAIVTLGETGAPEDRELLESFTFDEDRQIAAAAELALEKMDARNL